MPEGLNSLSWLHRHTHGHIHTIITEILVTAASQLPSTFSCQQKRLGRRCLSWPTWCKAAVAAAGPHHAPYD